MNDIQRETVIEPNQNLQNISEFFDHHGDTWISVYDQETQERWYEYYPIRIRERYACALIRDEPKGTAIDLGCGTGHALLEMARMNFSRIVGVDISEHMLECAQRLIRKNHAEGRVEIHRSDVQDLKMIPSTSVDVCTALGVIEYLPSDEPLLREVHRILKPNGVLVIQVRNRQCYKNRLTNVLRSLLPVLKSKIWYREHGPHDFAANVERQGFKVEERRFAHYYALFPFSYMPGVRILVRWLDNYLNKYLERRLSSSQISVILASMLIVKARKNARD